MTAATSLADQWTAHANRHLPNDASQAQVIRARRDWYGQQLDRLAAIPNRSAQEEALFLEAVGFGRTIGSAVEAATV